MLQDPVGEAGGGWKHAELQVNLEAMVAIKEGAGGGGHKAFDEARLIDAFSERTLRFAGVPSDVVFAMIGAGVLFVVNFQDQKMGPAKGKLVAAALQTPECRVRDLK